RWRRARSSALQVHVGMRAAARRPRLEALVGPLVLAWIAPRDALDVGIERGGGDGRIGIGDAVRGRRDPQRIVLALADALAPGEQDAGAAAPGQASEQGHGQRLHAEERCEFAVAALGLLV